MKSAELIKLVEQAGWKLINTRGSHHVFRHDILPGHISVPHPRKDLGIGLLKKLMKRAGIEEPKP
ncbi:MAG: type II toxin-antitoxin system HicA family toxin [Azoarcus sp.]|jgi:predicted RNA binding protein YcfA (HicA-like mRNA interferase family)|nr:type II toxin-antitoxin system HicA family toxin [Azoarcus sp.]